MYWWTTESDCEVLVERSELFEPDAWGRLLSQARYHAERTKTDD